MENLSKRTTSRAQPELYICSHAGVKDNSQHVCQWSVDPFTELYELLEFRAHD